MEANEIYQTHLDVVSDAVWRLDKDFLEVHIEERLTVETMDRHLRSMGRDETIAALFAFREAMESIGATGYHRVCSTAAFTTDHRIDGVHRTYVLRGGNYAAEPYLCEQRLCLHDGIWRMGDTRVQRKTLGFATFNGDRPLAVLQEAETRTPSSPRTCS